VWLRVLPHTVVDNSDTSPTRLRAWETLLLLPSRWSSPFSPFQTARIVLALQVFVFLLVVCLLLASFAALASLLVPSSTFLLTRKGQAHDAPSSPEAPLPRRWPRLSSRLPCLVGWRACACASLARGEKPARSPQAREHRGLRLSQPEVPLLGHHRGSDPRGFLGMASMARPSGSATFRGPACRTTFTARRHTPLSRLKTPSRAGSPWC
jgi:hypothetical protein